MGNGYYMRMQTADKMIFQIWRKKTLAIVIFIWVCCHVRQIKARAAIRAVEGDPIVEYCPRQEIKPPQLPYEAGDFPEEKFQNALASKDEAFRVFLDTLKEEVNSMLSDENNDEATDYPACLYARQCVVNKKVIYNWKLPDITGRNCWIIQPLIWTLTADTSPPNFQCFSEEFTLIGFACVQEYSTEAVWVYCDDGSITIKKVTIATDSTAQQYLCDPNSDQIV